MFKLDLYVPLVLTTIVMFIATIFTVIHFQEEHIYENKNDIAKQFNKLLKVEVDHQAKELEEYMHFIKRDKIVEKCFTSLDKKKIYDYILPIFEHLNHIDLTHMYFLKPDGQVLLRVHDYKRDGDFVKRTTFLESQKRQKLFYGLEFGIKKNYTLRVVQPWYVDGKLIGYLELGKEIDKFMSYMEKVLNSHIFMAVKKDIFTFSPAYVKEMLKKKLATRDHYIVYQTGKIPTEIQKILDGSIINTGITYTDEEKISEHFVSSTKLTDVSHRDLGYFVFLSDMSAEYISMKHSVYLVASLLAFLALLFMSFGYMIIRKKEVSINALATKLEESKEKADNASKSKSEFLANMSHEIRTPLNAILGFVNILKEAEQDKEKQEYLRIIDASSKTLLSTIGDILDFSKMETGKLDVEIIEFNPKIEFENVVFLFDAKATESDVDLTLHVDKKIPTLLKSDLHKIKQITSNLISNALKFTDKKKKIEILIGYTDKSLHVEVKDEGKGIREDKLEHIFEAFGQEDSSTTRKHGGTGLGLSISSSLAKLLGGELKVESRVGQGSRFYFDIPVELGEQIGQDSSDKIEKQLKTDIKLLLVEDNKSNQMFMKVVLKKLHIKPDIAKDGVDAVDMFKENSYDIILMDENMPNMNGIEATKYILRYEKENIREHTPIVALTANALKGDRERFLEAGMDEYMTKPLDKDRLVEVLLKYCK